MKLFPSLLAAWLLCATLLAQVPQGYPVVSDLGEMIPFYRYQPALTEWFHETPENIQATVPPFMTDKRISFPYKKRASDREILFCDNVTVVRFLGGWSASRKGQNPDEVARIDLAFRDEKGVIRYRWDLLPARLDPLLKMGYTRPTIVLDNVPWCFPKEAREPDTAKVSATAQPKGYGQNQPPADLHEWVAFIEELCRQLVARYGFELVNQWGFRLGTEMNQKVRWSGTAEEYAAFYVKTARAVRAVLPGARFGAYNRSGVDFESLAGVAALAKKEQVPFDWVATSLYSISRKTGPELNYATLDPDLAVARQLIPTWNAVSAASALGEALPKEIHEYGWFLVNQDGVNDKARGARGAAGNFYTMFALRRAGVSKLFHWILQDPSWGSAPPLFSSQAWLYSILDHTIGSRVLELKHDLKSPSPPTIKYKALGFCREKGRTLLIVGAYNMNRDELTQNTISIFVPAGVLPRKDYRVQATWMSNATDPYMALRHNLEKAGKLAPSLRDKPQVILAGNLMAPKGAAYQEVADHYPLYEGMMRDNLTLKAYPGQVSYSEKGAVFTFPIEAPMVMVLAVE